LGDNDRGMSSDRQPKWATALDVLAVVMAVMAIGVAVGGGFRLTLAGMRLSVTDWWRPAIMCVLAVAVRHLFRRADPLHRRAVRAAARWWQVTEARTVLPIHVATRGGVIAVGFLATLLIGFPNGAAPWRVGENEFVNLPARWDAGWYLGIAIEGYQFTPGRTDAQQNIAFFPALPMLTRALAKVLGNQPLWTAVGVSLVAFFFALVYLLKLARAELADEGAALAATTLLAAYPFAVFFSAAYTESLFLLTMVGAIYHFRRGELWQAAVWGFAAGLTRPNGCFLSIVLGLMAIEPLWKSASVVGTGDSRRTRLVVLSDRVAAAAAPGLGMLAYSTYIYFLTGHPFQWAAQNVAWGRTYRGPWMLVSDRAEYIASDGLYAYVSQQPTDFLYALAVLFVLGAAVPVYRRFGAPYAALLVVNTLPPLAIGGLLSMGRVTSVLFPAFLWLGAVIPAHDRTAWIAAFACLQGLVAVMFFTWRPLF
jgi:hypothetical protein